MYKNDDLCPVCGDGFLKEEKIQETFEYKDNYITIDNYIIYKCSDCEESFVDPDTLKKTEKVIRDFHRKVDGLLISEEIKSIRKFFGYTQEKFGSILGGGTKGFARYENGTITQSKSMDNLLRIIKKFPYTLVALTDNATYEPDYIVWDTNSRKTIFLSVKSGTSGIISDAETDGIVIEPQNPLPKRMVETSGYSCLDTLGTIPNPGFISYGTTV